MNDTPPMIPPAPRGSILGPITWDLYVHIESLDGTKRGKITVGQPPGVIPTEESIKKAFATAVQAIPDGYRLMRPDTYFSVIVEEVTGVFQQWAPSATYQYDADALEVEARATVVSADE